MKVKLLMLILIVLIGCSDDADSPNVMVENENMIDIGTYTLLQESISTIPYQLDNTVVFVDSTGTEMLLEITSQELIKSGPSRLFRYNVNMEGDTISYLYTTEFKHSYIVNEEHNLSFRATLKAQPLYSDPESRSVSDIYQIFCTLPNNIITSAEVFVETINQRTWPTSIDVKVLGDVEIFGRTFENVRMTEFTNPKSDVLFNYELGLVSFTDHENEVWRFERFE